MAAQRRRQFGGRQRGATDWGRLVGNLTTISVASKALVATFVLSNPGIGETVRRTRGRFFAVSDQASVVEQITGAMGMIVVSDLAIAAGVASIPGPVTDASDDGWFVWEPFITISQVTIGVSNAGAGTQPWFEFDSKAMRKVADGFGIAIVFESLAQGIEVNIGASLLSSRT